MDLTNDDIIASAVRFQLETRNLEAIKTLEPLLKKERRKTLSPQQEFNVLLGMSQNHRLLCAQKVDVRKHEQIAVKYARESASLATAFWGTASMGFENARR